MARATNPKSIQATTNRVANLPPEEPDAGNLHVRVCEGASGQPLALLGAVVSNQSNKTDGSITECDRGVSL